MALPSPTDSENSFDSRHAQHHGKDVRFSDRPLLDSHSRWRRVPRAGRIWLNEMMPAGRHMERAYEFGAHKRILLSPEVIVRAARSS